MNHSKHRACYGKIRHRTQRDAWKALKGTMETTGELGLVYYRCRHCSSFHVGHAEHRDQRRLRAQRLVERIEWALRQDRKTA